VNNIIRAREIMNSKSTFVFDFDGVIADSFDVKKNAFSKLYLKYGEEVANKVSEFHEKASNGGMCRVKKFNFFHQNFLDISISSNQIDELCSNFSSLVVEDVINCPEISGVTQFLENYCINKSKISIVNSATPQEEMNQIIVERGLSKFFSGIYGSPKTKVENFNNLFLNYNLKPEETVFFGDLTSDFNAANEVGCDFIGIGDRIDFEYIASHSHNQFAFLDNFDNI
jgi:phosphoglycolate phosphatase-like HAD superfamily hydrolase